MRARRRSSPPRTASSRATSKASALSSRRATPSAAPPLPNGSRISVSRWRSARSAPCRASIREIYIADTIGELGTLYALSPLAFIGGSLVERGGQNPIEAVRHGVAVITGPHWQNFTDAYRALLRHHGAVEVKSARALTDAVSRLLADVRPSLPACVPARRRRWLRCRARWRRRWRRCCDIFPTRDLKRAS